MVRDSGGYAVALSWSMPNVYDVGAGQTMFTASDVGWVVGHSYIVYAPLLVGATTVLYEGKPVGTPDAGQFWRVVAEHGVQAACSPRRPRSGRSRRRTRTASTRAKYDLSTLRVPVPRRRAAGPGDLPLGDRAARRPGDRPLVADRDRLADRRQPGRHRAAADQARLADRPLPGWDVQVLDASGKPVGRGKDGAIVRQAADAARVAADAVERRRAVRLGPTCRRSTATTSPATAATSTRTATSSSWAAPTT